VRIREETRADWPVIEALTLAAFRGAAHASHTEQFIVAALRGAGKLAVSLVAEAHGTVVGHVALSPVSISDATADWYGLGPLSVTPALQRRGVGAGLARAALEVLRTRGAGGCVVLGEPGYYGRFGFRAEPGLSLAGVPAHYFQALSFGRGMPRGRVTYHEAFDL
jgi:putative acetyltransferase